MKGFVIFALLIVGVYSAGPLKEIRLNIKDENGCGGQNLRIRIRRPNGNWCETAGSGRFRKGAVLTWNWWDFRDCEGFEFDQDAQFSLVYTEGRRDTSYCPALIEFLAYERRNWWGRGEGRVASFKKNMDDVRPRIRRFTVAYNARWFNCLFNNWDNAIPNEDFIEDTNREAEPCPSQEQGCPVNELQALRPTGRARKQCIFNCPFVKRVQERNGEWKNVGQICHDVTYRVTQHDYCCRRSGTGFEQCPDELF